VRILTNMLSQSWQRLNGTNTRKKCVKYVELKRKFSFSFFCENSAKICFRFSRKKSLPKVTKITIVHENFRENENFRKK
jgi:hypothetical protein